VSAQRQAPQGTTPKPDKDPRADGTETDETNPHFHPVFAEMAKRRKEREAREASKRPNAPADGSGKPSALVAFLRGARK
jgi:hypothetical protein